MCLYLDKNYENEYLGFWWQYIFHFIFFILGWMAFGTWMHDVRHDDYDSYPSCLTALYSLMLAFDIVLSCCALICASQTKEIPAWYSIGYLGILRFLLSCTNIALISVVIYDSQTSDDSQKKLKFLHSNWYWALFSMILLASFLTGPYIIFDGIVCAIRT